MATFSTPDECGEKSVNGGRNCFVVGCKNSDQTNAVWAKTMCPIHGVLRIKTACTCPLPVQWRNFPTKSQQPELREAWIRAIRRADDGHGFRLLEPGKKHRVCEDHFEPGETNPTINLGYRKPAPSTSSSDRSQRSSKRAASTPTTPCPTNKRRRLISSPKIPVLAIFIIAVLTNLLRKCKLEKQNLLEENDLLKQEILDLKRTALSEEDASRVREENTGLCDTVTQLKEAAEYKKNHVEFDEFVLNDEDCLFYTGIEKLSLFNAILDKVSPLIRRMWRGKQSSFVNARRNFKNSPKKMGPPRKLSIKCEMLMTLMWLKLGLHKEDLARRFKVSQPHVTRITKTWLSVLAKFLSTTIYWPSKNVIHNTKPSKYLHLVDLRAIADCSEIFLERPKSRRLQRSTWSRYKHHNTAKFLIAVAPNSAITFLSPAYGGRISDKEITMTTGFLDKFDPHDMLQVDKGFLIGNECSERLIHLHIPPGVRGNAQLSRTGTRKTTRIANLWIIVEQVIGRMKAFNIIRGILPASIAPDLDKILQVIGGIVNFQKPIYGE